VQNQHSHLALIFFWAHDSQAQAVVEAAKLMQAQSTEQPVDKALNDKLIIYTAANRQKLEAQGKAQSFFPEAVLAAVADDVNRNIEKLKDHEVEYVTEELTFKEKMADKIRAYADQHADIALVANLKEDEAVVKEEDRDLYSINKQGCAIPHGSKAICLVIKQNAELIEKQRRILCVIDGSEVSHAAVTQAVNLLRPNDCLQILFIETRFCAAPGKKVVKYYTRWLADNKVKGTCVCIKHDEKLSLAEEIMDFAEGKERYEELTKRRVAHIIAMGSMALSTVSPEQDLPAAEEVAHARRDVAESQDVAQEVLLRAQFSHVLTLSLESIFHRSIAPELKEWFSSSSPPSHSEFFCRMGYL